MTTQLFYVGTYTRDGSEGIYLCQLDVETGAMEQVASYATSNPSFVTLQPEQRYLYTVNEDMTFEGHNGGGLSAYALDANSGELTFLNHQPTHGGAPCHVSLDDAGQFALVANYMGGNVSIFPIEADGRLAPASDTIQHVGSSVNPERQQEPHAHSVNLDPAQKYAFVADLGLDKMMIYRIDRENGKLVEHTQRQIHAGAGPRHFAFHPNGRLAYLINELDSTITAFTYDAEAGTLSEIQVVPTLPDDFEGRSTCADIHILSSGDFLYGSNRGHDSLVIYAIDQDSGQLSHVGHQSTGGQNPRNFGFTPDETLLLAANQNSHNIISFYINQQTGTLTPTGHKVEVPWPVCIHFLK